VRKGVPFAPSRTPHLSPQSPARVVYDLTDQELEDVITALDAADHGSKGAVLQRWAKRLSPDPSDPMSAQTLRRRIRQQRGKAKECPGRPAKIPEALIEFVEEAKARGMEMGLGEREVSTEIALRIARRKGVEGAEDASPSAVNTRLRKRGFREETRYRKVEADFATQRQLLDFSRSKYLQVRDYDEDADDWLLEVTDKQLSYKDPEGAFRTWYALLIDDYSRLKVGRLFCDTSENALLGLTFLRWAWTREEDDHPMRHVPRILQTDFGAFRRSHRVQNAFDSLEDVDLKKAGKESQGKIERSFRSLWQRFELPFALEHGDGYQIHASDFNHLLHEHLLKEGMRAHPSQDEHTCKHLYEGSIARTPPLQMEADVVKLAFNTDTRQVDPYGRISIDGDKYRCPDSIEGIAIEPGMHVRYQINAEGRVIGRLVERNHQDAFDLEPWSQPAFEEHGDESARGTGRTKLERLRRQVDVTSDLRTDLLDDDAPEVEVDEDGILAQLGERHVDVSVDSDFDAQPTADDTPVPAAQAREWIGQRLSSIDHTYADAAHIFDPLLGDATQPELDKVINAYLDKHSDTESTPH